MIIHPAPQGSGAWMMARAGVITASEFDKLLTPKGWKPSASRTPYLCRLAAESLLGTCDELTPSRAMERGTELEPEARAAYHLATGNVVTEVGLCFRDEARRVGCSPDGLIGDAIGGLELKCPGAAKHVEYLLGGVCPSDYAHQVQGCLYVTGAPWWDFMSYYPGLPLFIVRVTPDAAYHEALAVALGESIAEMDTIMARLRALEEEA